MKVKYFDKSGKSVAAGFELNDDVFAVDVNNDLLNQAVYVYLSNQRQSNAHTKDRGEVSGGGRKPWKQKGTGRARQGSTRSPQWKGGGVVFGPTNNMNYKRTLSKKMRKAAMMSALSNLAAKDGVVVFQDVATTQEKRAKSIIKILDSASLDGKILFVHSGARNDIVKSASNLNGVDVQVVSSLSPYLLLKYDVVAILEETVPTIYENWGSK